jgi:hypothetical protein
MIAQDYTERFNPWCLNSILVKCFENNNQQLSKSFYFILFSLFGCPCINVFFGSSIHYCKVMHHNMQLLYKK